MKRVVLSADAIIGRSSKCNLRIASSQISRRHCKLTVMDSGVLVRDLESANGTYVDGKLIPPNQDVALTSGSRLAVGPVQFLVYYEASNPAIQQPGSTIELPAIKLKSERSEESGVDAPAGAPTADWSATDAVPPMPVRSSAEEDVDEDESSATETVVVDLNVIQRALAEGFSTEPDDEEPPPAESAIDDLPETKELAVRVDPAEEEKPDKAAAEMESLVSEAVDEDETDLASIFDEAPTAGDDAPAISAPDREESLEAVEEAEAVAEEEEEKPKRGSLFGGLFSFGRKRGRKQPDEAAPAAATEVEADKTAEDQDRQPAETAAATQSAQDQPVDEPAEDEPNFDNLGVDVGDKLDYNDADEEYDDEEEEKEEVDENLSDFFSQFEE